MTTPSRTASGFLAVTVLAVAGALAITTAVRTGRSATVTVSVTRKLVSGPIPAGFLGLSMEYRGLAAYAGSDPNAVDPVFEQLLRNLSPGQGLVLRVGGQSTERTWWPVAGMPRPHWAQYTLTPGWLEVARTLTADAGVRLILGINLEASSAPLASAEARAMLGGIGSKAIAALEIGNEPELYGAFPWYQFPRGVHHFGRSSSYSFNAYLPDYSRIARVVTGAPLAGPSSGAAEWLPDLSRFLRAQPRVRVATMHTYPLKHCGHRSHVTIAQLLSNASSIGLAGRVGRYVAMAHAHHVPLRVDEMNAVSCGGQTGVSNTFGTALWALDALFAMRRAGVDGINIHTVPGTINELLSAEQTKAGWRSEVHPQYYGMLMFAQASPTGSRLLRVTGSSGGLRAWATRARDGTVRVVLINKNVGRSETVRLRVAAAAGAAALERLRAPSVHATGGVTIGGQSFGAETSTGQLGGVAVKTSVVPARGVYAVAVPPASAALLTVSAR